MKLTDEQALIAQSKAHVLLVSAYAGTGKTSTLIEYAKANPEKRMTYLAFNKAVKEEAQTKFPSNVKCVTAHGLAYAKYGSAYSHKLNNPKPYHLMSALNIEARLADTVLSVVNKFLASSELVISESHVVAPLDGVKTHANSIINSITFANKAWKMMCDVESTKIPMPHDGYLKLFQMAGGTINTEVILFDESQDASPIMIAIVEASSAKKVYVGDENQAIYGFRGAVNAMATIKADEHLFLTASFRFGGGVAKLANAILGQYRKLEKPVRGLGQHATQFSVDVSKPHTRLSRTNSALFDEAVKAYRSNRPFGFVGNVKNYGFDTIVDAYNLKVGNRGAVRDSTIKSFNTFEQMNDYAEAVDDKELKVKAKIVNEYMDRIPMLVTHIQNNAVEDLSKADIILTTAHKSKGLEWANVYLTDDFCDMLCKVDEETNVSVEPDREEINLLYVAVTRAERCISVNETLHQWLDEIGFFEAIQTRNSAIDCISQTQAQSAQLALA